MTKIFENMRYGKYQERQKECVEKGGKFSREDDGESTFHAHLIDSIPGQGREQLNNSIPTTLAPCK